MNLVRSTFSIAIAAVLIVASCDVSARGFGGGGGFRGGGGGGFRGGGSTSMSRGGSFSRGDSGGGTFTRGGDYSRPSTRPGGGGSGTEIVTPDISPVTMMGSSAAPS